MEVSLLIGGLGMRMFLICAQESAELEEKIRRELVHAGEKVAIISLYGGPLAFAYPSELQSELSVFLRQIRFHVKKFAGKKEEENEVVFIWHECGFYAEIHIRANMARMEEDAKRGTEYARRLIRGIKIISQFDTSLGKDYSFKEICPLETPQPAQEAEEASAAA